MRYTDTAAERSDRQETPVVFEAGDRVTAAPCVFMPFVVATVTVVWQRDGVTWVQTGRGAASLSVPARKLRRIATGRD